MAKLSEDIERAKQKFRMRIEEQKRPQRGAGQGDQGSGRLYVGEASSPEKSSNGEDVRDSDDESDQEPEVESEENDSDEFRQEIQKIEPNQPEP